ncbi:unnamed protein product [Peniophora sp. CBMAI 1063]|nr:unnamed protein product [Peniophora sp. CBMAI 1063]
MTDYQPYKNATRAKGRVVVIAGGATGIGKEIALTFGKHGAKVVVGDLDISGGKTVFGKIKEHLSPTYYVPGRHSSLAMRSSCAAMC